MPELTIALTKGSLLAPSLDLLRRANIRFPELEKGSRKLIFESEDGKYRAILTRATDNPTYVEYGAADLGISGKDVIIEEGKQVFELVDLGIGKCKMVLAFPEERIRQIDEEGFSSLVIATKYPRIAREFFRKKNVQVDIIKLYGSVELAPLVGLSDGIVDIVSTGRTLRENGLKVYEDILDISARLIGNVVSRRTKYKVLRDFEERIREVVNGE